MEVSVDLICVGGLNVNCVGGLNVICVGELNVICRESDTGVPYSEDPEFASRLRHRLSGLYTIFFPPEFLQMPGQYMKLVPLPHFSTLNLVRY